MPKSLSEQLPERVARASVHAARSGHQAPVLHWNGRSAVTEHHEHVPCRRLETVHALSRSGPDDVGNSGDETPSHEGPDENLIVQGDNLHALKALLPRYAGRVKCIYIDPPYNTGNTGWRYDDRVTSPAMRRWLGNVLGESGGLDRHDRWLCMMYPRLMLLKQFLRPDGVIFVSIDDTELHHLACLMDEIFGRAHRLALFTWQRKKKGSNLSKALRKVTEYVIAYRGGPEKVALHGTPARADKRVPLLNRANGIGTIAFPAGVVRVGKGFVDGKVAKGTKAPAKGALSVELRDDIEVVGGIVATSFSVSGRWRWSQSLVDAELAKGSRFFLSRDFRINVARHDQAGRSKAPPSLLTPADGIGTNEDAFDELRDLFPERPGLPFDYPKPSSLIAYLVRASTAPGDVVLDAFAGSGTTAHAVLAVNAEDAGGRHFVLVEIDERIAVDVTAERVRRVMHGYTNARGERIEGLGGGFRFCRLGKPLSAADGRTREHVNVAAPVI